MNLKELYQISKTELKDIMPNNDADFRLEQVEFDKILKKWNIVISFLTEKNNVDPFLKLSVNPLRNYLPKERVYKKLTINDQKEVEGFYIYSPNQC